MRIELNVVGVAVPTESQKRQRGSRPRRQMRAITLFTTSFGQVPTVLSQQQLGLMLNILLQNMGRVF
jgi:hypothetical protein